MLIISVTTWEPEKRDEVFKRFAEVKGSPSSPGRKVIGSWSVIGGNKVFRLVEIEDPKALAEAVAPWSDLVKIDEIPVMETAEYMKLISGK